MLHSFQHFGTTSFLLQVRQECLSQIACAESTLRDIEQTYPEVAGAIKTQSLLKCMIKQAKGAAQSLLHGGELQETDFGAIIDDLQKKEKRLTLPRKLVSDPTTLLRNVGLFHQLSPEILEEVELTSFPAQKTCSDVVSACRLGLHKRIR